MKNIMQIGRQLLAVATRAPVESKIFAQRGRNYHVVVSGFIWSI